MQTSDFITQHGSTVFWHSDELFACIRSGACVLNSFPNGDQRLPGSHFQRIYQIRAAILRERSFSTSYASAIIADMEALAHAFENYLDEPCGIWSFSLPPHHMFSVYDALRSRCIIGCIKAVDRRLVDDQTWAQLWCGEAQIDLP